MDKSNYINSIIKEKGYKNYLEIGSGDNYNFDQIKCSHKIGVDPKHNMDSDTFFKQNIEFFDCIFIDGLHHAEQVRKDITNSLRCLTKDGVIILHDTLPHNKEMQEVPRKQKVWTGDCWKAAVGFKKSFPDVEFYTHRADYGLSVLYPNGKKTKKHFDKIEMPFEEFKENEVELLNVIC